MSQPEKVFDFLTERRLGVAGQNLALAALCCDTDWRVVGATSDTREQERLHVDQLAEFQGSRVLVEIKTDMRGLQTQRLAFESVHSDGERGWLHATTAAYVVTLVAERDGIEAHLGQSEVNRAAALLVMGVQDLRREFPAWERTYAGKTVHNPGYSTKVVPVPIATVRKSPALVREYGVAYRYWRGVRQVTAVRRPEGRGVFTIEHPTE